ncbi:MAG: hypothetical protein CML41_00135 [Rhodobacteraceae bacterium]|nr:hypothetical protein [Paracoccaceae bacterium]|tara:strand:- start:1488 stop:3323 length:1836 start_codon:yes stop_codon:yes gene_type:complete
MTISFGSSSSDSNAEMSEHFDEQRLKEEKVKESNATKLLAAAWFIEICAAGIGFFFAYTTGEATRKYLAQDTEAFIGNPEISVLLAMLPFMIIGVVELTKIPLAYAAYNAKPGFWKALFIGVLLSLCFITGETIFTGMERSLDNQLKYFEGDKKLQEELKVDVLNLEKVVIELESERPIDDIDREYDSEIRTFEQNHYIKLDELNDERQGRLTELETKKLESRDMFNNASSQNEIGNLQRILDTQLSSIKDRENRLDSEIQNIRQTAQLEIDSKQNQITVLSESIAAITQEFTSGLFSNNSQKEDQLEAERNAREKAEIELESIKLKRDEDIKSFREMENIKLSQLQEGIASTQLRLTEARLKSEAEFDKEQEGINIEINQLVARYDSRQADIQKKYEEEKSLRENNYSDARQRAERVQSDLDQARADIKNTKEEIIDVEQTINSKAGEIQVMRFAATYAAFISDGERQGVENVTPEDIGIIMLFWFGSIALIAATTGTVISFASFYIRDRKNWEYSWKDDLDEESRWQELLESRRQKNKVRREYYLKRINGELEPGIFRSIGSSIVRLIDAMIKRLKDPKIIKQKVPPVKKYIPYDYSTGKPVDDDTKDD